MNKKVHKNTKTLELLYSKKDFQKFGLKSNKFKISALFKKNVDEKSRIIKGYASTTDRDRVDDEITLGALKKAKGQLLEKGSNTVFFNHDKSKPIGKVLSTELDEKGLIVKVFISKASDVNDIWLKIKEGILSSFSIGGRFKKVQVERDEKGEIISFKILELELYEVSVVGIPANSKANIFEVIEKSFGISKKGKRMKKKIQKNKDSKLVEQKNIKKKLTRLTVKRLIKKSNTEMLGLIGSVVESMKSLNNEIKVLNGKLRKQKIAKKSKENDVLKNLMSELGDIKKSIRVKASKKGFVGNKEKHNSKKKVTKVFGDIDNPEAVRFAKQAMSDMNIYNNLSTRHKEQVKNCYMGILHRQLMSTAK